MRKSRNTYFYMVTISGLYVLMILLLHSRLQIEIYQPRLDCKQTAVYRHNHSLTVRPVVTSSIHLTPKSSCHQPSESKSFMFQTVKKEFFYVYTAYLDARMNITYVRIMSILLKGVNKYGIVICSFKQENDQFFHINATLYEMCENHNKKFGGHIVSCPLPKNFTEPCQVGIRIVHTSDSTFTSDNVTLKLIKLTPSTAKHRYSVCVPPLFGNVNFSRLIEFMEFSQYFGAEKFIFYSNNIQNEKALEALEFYSNRKVATVIPWKVPSEIKGAQIWYHGQLIAHNDCLYRSMSLTEKLAIQDIDELIVPHDRNIFWDGAITPLFKDNVVGLGIHSTFFDTSLDGEVLALSSNRRTKMFSRLRTKVLVKPLAIFEVGIHHVSKPLFENYRIISPSTDVVVLHHYRKCMSNYGMNCRDWVIDETVKHKYGHIQHRIARVNSLIFQGYSNKPVNAQIVTVTENKFLS